MGGFRRRCTSENDIVIPVVVVVVSRLAGRRIITTMSTVNVYGVLSVRFRLSTSPLLSFRNNKNG